MIPKLAAGEYRFYLKKGSAKTGKHRSLGMFKARVAAEKHEQEAQYFKWQG